MTDRLSRLINSNGRLFFISPHFDDVILSCGGLLYEAAQMKPGRITIINIFTKGKTGYKTTYNQQFMRNCGFADAELLFKARQKEENNVAELLKIHSLSLGLVDAAWRKNDKVVDNQLLRAIKKINIGKNDIIFTPLSVGGHRDHLLSRAVVKLFPRNTIAYYSDFPYNLRHPVPVEFIKESKLVPISWARGLANKEKLISLYKSQLRSLFPKGLIPVLREVYYLSKSP